MRHLKEFEEDEIFSDVDDLSALGFDTYSGYVIAYNTTNAGNVIGWGYSLVVIIANSEKQAIDTFLSDYEDWEGDLADIKEWEDVVMELDDWFGMDGVVYIDSIWRGLKPRVLKNEPSIETINAYNPYSAIQDLEKMFSNAKEIMTKYPLGGMIGTEKK
jgi:hypothetical protein